MTADSKVPTLFNSAMSFSVAMPATDAEKAMAKTVRTIRSLRETVIFSF
jgi:hypothetical protein